MKTITKDKKQKEKNTSSIDKTQIQISLELWETAKKRQYKEMQWEDVELMFNTCSYLVKARRNRFRWTAYLTPIWLR